MIMRIEFNYTRYKLSFSFTLNPLKFNNGKGQSLSHACNSNWLNEPTFSKQGAYNYPRTTALKHNPVLFLHRTKFYSNHSWCQILLQSELETLKNWSSC